MPDMQEVVGSNSRRSGISFFINLKKVNNFDYSTYTILNVKNMSVTSFPRQEDV